jgi:hypothetical protein
MAKVANAGYIPAFDSNAQIALHSGVQAATGLDLGIDFFKLQPLMRGSVAQVSYINTAAYFQKIHLNGATWNIIQEGYGTHGPGKQLQPAVYRAHAAVSRLVRVRYQQTPQQQAAQNNLNTAAAAGTVFATGGGAMIVASGTSVMAADASVTAATLFTGGAALVVIGVVLVGYYAYQWIQANTTQTGTTLGGPVTNMAPDQSIQDMQE